MEEVRANERKAQQELEEQLEQEKVKSENLRQQTVTQLQSLLNELSSIDQANKTLNFELETERKAHSVTLQQLQELKESAQDGPSKGVLMDAEQQIKLNIQIKGGKIKVVELVEEAQTAERDLSEENMFLTQKCCTLMQEKQQLENEYKQSKDQCEAMQQKFKVLGDKVLDAQNAMNQQLEEERRQNDLMDEAVTVLRQMLGGKAEYAISTLPEAYRKRLLKPLKNTTLKPITPAFLVEEFIPPPAAPPPVRIVTQTRPLIPPLQRTVPPPPATTSPSLATDEKMWIEMAKKIGPPEPHKPKFDPTFSHEEYKQYMQERKIYDEWEEAIAEMSKNLSKNASVIGLQNQQGIPLVSPRVRPPAQIPPPPVPASAVALAKPKIPPPATVTPPPTATSPQLTTLTAQVTSPPTITTQPPIPALQSVPPMGSASASSSSTSTSTSTSVIASSPPGSPPLLPANPAVGATVGFTPTIPPLFLKGMAQEEKSRAAQVVEDLLQSVRANKEEKVEQDSALDLKPSKQAMAGGSVTSMILCPKHVWVGSSGKPGYIQLFDKETAVLSKELKIPSGVHKLLAVVAHVWVTSDDNLIRVFNMLSPSFGRDLSGHSRPIVDLTNVNDKQVWSSSSDMTLKMWSADTFNCLRTIEFHTLIQKTLLYNSNIWIGTPQGIYTCDINSRKITEQPREKNSVTAMVFVRSRNANSDEIWTAHANNSIVVWDATQKTLSAKFSAVRVQDLLCLGQRVWSCSLDKTIKVWDVKTRACLSTITSGHTGFITCLLLVPARLNSSVWSASDDGKICVWETHFGSHDFQHHTLKVNAHCIVCYKSIGQGKAAYQCRVCTEVNAHPKCVPLVPSHDLCIPVHHPIKKATDVFKRRTTPPHVTRSTSSDNLHSFLRPPSSEGRQTSRPLSILFSSPPLLPPSALVMNPSYNTPSPTLASADGSSGGTTSGSNREESTSSSNCSSYGGINVITDSFLREFERNPVASVQKLVADKLIAPSAKAIAQLFLDNDSSLNRTALCEYLAERTDVLHEYAQMQDFSILDFEMALRRWVGVFISLKAPPKMEVVMTEFAQRVCATLPEREMFSTPEVVKILATDCIALSNSLHAPQAVFRTSLQKWTDTHATINKAELPRDFLEHLYNQILDCQLDSMNLAQAPIMQGMLIKKGNVTNSPKWCVLNRTQLNIFKTAKSPTADYMLPTHTLEAKQNTPTTVIIQTPSSSTALFLLCKSAYTAKAWMRALSAASAATSHAVLAPPSLLPSPSTSPSLPSASASASASASPPPTILQQLQQQLPPPPQSQSSPSGSETTKAPPAITISSSSTGATPTYRHSHSRSKEKDTKG
ncbi:hypothetical protein Pelo_856 [Pelomyxa schiedti]|nr:hypothetical protein Pelo_856 [Pelomyxa schiedti]